MNKDHVLLGIKYEAAKLADVDETALARISDQIDSEVGEDWESNPSVVHGRNAVRVEQGVPRLGEEAHEPADDPATARHSLLRRIFGG